MDSESELNEDNFLNDEEKAGIEKLREELNCGKEEKAEDVIKKAIELIQKLSKLKDEMEANN